eukprot:TRINITY_DN61300_c0_g1_i1.p1 TRINITY_DN61300_c0_g1~~TRINITY_DN61300_c0_g1_i1.p1  ORF type:complete len:732 (-),score=360.80 TRINITY_DN61300_c0_g1_i1:621-2606(-)
MQETGGSGLMLHPADARGEGLQARSATPEAMRELGLGADIKVRNLAEVKMNVFRADSTHYAALYQQLRTMDWLKSNDKVARSELTDYADLEEMIQDRMLPLQSDLIVDLEQMRSAQQHAGGGLGDAMLEDVDGGGDHADGVRQQQLAEQTKDVMRIASFAKQQYQHAPIEVERMQTCSVNKNPSKWFKHQHLLQRPRLRQFWKSPTVIVREDREHRASWNELFFDLIFVVIFASLGHHLEAHMTLSGVGEFVVLFTATWRVWSGANTYINRFNPADAMHKFVLYYLTMVFVLGMAVHKVRGVVGSYLAARVLTESLTLWAAYHEPKVRAAAIADASIFALSAAPWLLSLTLDPDGNFPSVEQYSLWAIGLFIEVIGMMLISLCVKSVRIPLNVEHMTERFGLFTILTMGEQVVALLWDDEDSGKYTYLLAVLGGMLVFAFQIVYFDVETNRPSAHALVLGGWRANMWYLVHLPLQCSIVSGAASKKIMLLSSLEDSHGHESKSIHLWVFAVSVAVTWLCFNIISMSHGPMTKATYISSKTRVVLRFVAFATALIVPGVNSFVHTDDSLSPMTPNIATSIIVGVSAIVAAVDLYGCGLVEPEEQEVRLTEHDITRANAKHLRPASSAPAGTAQSIKTQFVRQQSNGSITDVTDVKRRRKSVT